MAITSLDQLDLNGTYSYADYLTWQFDEYVELIKGKIFKMTPAPLRLHQDISGNLFVDFHNYLKGEKYKVYQAPFDVRLLKNPTKDTETFTVVQPDICIVCDPEKLDNRGCMGAPDLIVEILSTSTSYKDIKIKYALYEQNGVKEYWIVYPGENLIDVFDLIDEKYILRNKYTIEDEIPVGIFSNFSVKAKDIFSE